MQFKSDKQIKRAIVISYKAKVEIKDKEINQLKETLSNVLLAYSKQRKEFNIPIKPQSIIDAEKLLKSLK